MTDKSGEQLLAGNFDEIGASDNVLSRISGESHQVGRLDKDVYSSWQKCKEKFMLERNSPRIKDFIQSISIHPIIVHFWT